MDLKSGKFELIIGCMFSGKTTELLRRYNRYKIGGKKCLLIKHSSDNRYSDSFISTHDKILKEALSISCLEKVDNLINNYDVIFIDEIQFFKDAIKFCKDWCDMS